MKQWPGARASDQIALAKKAICRNNDRYEMWGLDMELEGKQDQQTSHPATKHCDGFNLLLMHWALCSFSRSYFNVRDARQKRSVFNVWNAESCSNLSLAQTSCKGLGHGATKRWDAALSFSRPLSQYLKAGLRRSGQVLLRLRRGSRQPEG